jgi:hypothetical protein|tara:strand:- start:655 stop:759 length:105 start_codon:yes stop_codon:yes gene_type:complete
MKKLIPTIGPDSADALARLGADSDYPNSGVEEKG